jgi:gluconolactonase
MPIGVPDGPQNLAFAGPDRKTLFILGRNAVWKIAMLSQGVKGRYK